MKKRDTFILIAFLILSQLMISSIIHYFQNREEKSEIVAVDVPKGPIEEDY